MSRSRSVPSTEEDLRLPRPPGVVRRFWGHHPFLADLLIALLCLLLTLTPPASLRDPDGDGLHVTAVPLVALTVLACALLLRRRRWPAAVATAAYLLAIAFLFAPAPVGPLTVLFASYGLAVYGSVRMAWIGLAIGLSALSAVALLLALTGVIGWPITVNAVIGEGMLALIGTLIGVNVGNRKRYVEAIIDRSRQLLRERDQQAQLAAAAERARIAREMHDIVSHSLTVVVALTEGAAATPDRNRARAATLHAAETARGALHEMRGMLGVLREAEDATAPLMPVEPESVDSVVESARRAGFPVALRTRGAGQTLVDLPRTIRFAVSRVVQEGLTNAMRHAPSATAIDVQLVVADDVVTVEVRNDGVRDHVSEGGYGLRGLDERVGFAGGSVVAGIEDGGWWRLRAVLPLEASAGAATPAPTRGPSS